MADQVLVPTNGGDNLFGGNGGGGFGGLLTGMLMSRMLGPNGFGDGYGNGAGANALSTNQILQSMAQQQANSALVNIVQDVNRVGHDVATSAAATQAEIANATLNQTVATLQGQNALSNAIANTASDNQSAIAASTLNQTVATLQGQTVLTSNIKDSTATNMAGHTNILGTIAATNADLSAQINNARNGTSSDIREALGVIDADIHAISSQLSNDIARTRDDVNTAHRDMINSAHHAEITGLRSAYDTQKAVFDSAMMNQRTTVDEAEKTRALIQNINTADLNRQIVVAENRLAEALADHRNTRATSDIIINNNNNNNAVATAIAQQQQQQQITAMSTGLTTALNQLKNLTQISLNTGTQTGVGQFGRQ
jgi:hypothetical protein